MTLPSANPTLVDRSRFVCGQECQLKRYWQYHWRPSGQVGEKKAGLVPQSTSLDLWLGLLGHDGLARLLEGSKGGTVPSQDLQRLYWKEAQAAAGLPPGSPFTQSEQLALAEGLYWGFVRSQLPHLLEAYEILWVEKEIALDLSPQVRLMTRPDLLLRRKSDRKVILVDFKTTKSLSDYFMQEFRDSPQMAAYTLAAEKFLGEPIEEYMIWALLKGGRERFTKKGGHSTAEPRNYSPLLYAKFSEPMPPLVPETSWDLGGYWYDKVPSWEQSFSQSEPGESKMETWVRLLPLATLYEQYAMVGPYPRQAYAGQLFLDSLLGEELRWAEKLAKLGASPSHDDLIRGVGPSFKCWNYGQRCSYYDLCFKTSPAHLQPLENGFTMRKPHHEEEKEQG